MIEATQYCAVRCGAVVCEMCSCNTRDAAPKAEATKRERWHWWLTYYVDPQWVLQRWLHWVIAGRREGNLGDK